MKRIVVLYHADCPDGFSAAWAAWKKFGNRAEYIPVYPETLPKKTLKGRKIYFLDNGCAARTFRQLARVNESVVVIDHHESREKDTKHFPQNVFDTSHSAAVLAWRYFHPRRKIPRFLTYIEDGDLWRFKLPQARTILSYIYARPFDFREYGTLARGMESARERRKYFVLGRVIADYNRVLVDEVVRRAELVRFAGYRVLAVNSSSKRFHSEVGHELIKHRPPLSIVWRAEQGTIHVSLRSNGRVDVSEIAARFPGGGGHPRAAGFSVPLARGFPWIPLETDRPRRS
ncbi:MAG: DHHA1 domain-containing protein [Candidatus Jorgensenbacteria bacterium]